MKDIQDMLKSCYDFIHDIYEKLKKISLKYMNKIKKLCKSIVDNYNEVNKASYNRFKHCKDIRAKKRYYSSMYKYYGLN